MSKYKQYLRTNVAEARPVTDNDTVDSLREKGVSISYADAANGSPKPGDMIARNPKSHKDKWLIAHDYFAINFVLKDG